MIPFPWNNVASVEVSMCASLESSVTLVSNNDLTVCAGSGTPSIVTVLVENKGLLDLRQLHFSFFHSFCSSSFMVFVFTPVD
jgi:hypothetical protein